MKTILNYLHYIAVAVMVALFTACGSHRKALTPEQLATASVEDRFDAMVSSYKPWHSLSVPVKVELRSPSRLSLSGRAYMVKDSLVHVSMRVLGFEVAYMHVTRDSVYCVDKVHHLAVIEGIDRLSSNAGITLGQLQSLLIGRAIIPGQHGDLTRKSRNITLKSADNESDMWSMTAVSTGQYPYTCVYDVDPAVNQVSSVTVELPGRNPVAVSYQSPVECQLGYFPSSLSCDVTVASKRLDASLRYTTGSLRINNADVPSFSRPGSNYRIIKAADLVKSLSSASLF